MKRKFRTRISCLLIASLCIGLLSATALAAEPVGTEAPAAVETPAPSSGESTGTVEAPTVTKTVTTDTKQDTPAPGQTTTTTTTEKTWDGRDGTEENGTTVKGSETTTETTVTGPDGSRDTTGTQTGSELTTETKTTTETKEDQPSDKKTTETITRTGIEEGEENPAGTETVKSEETAQTETQTGVTPNYAGVEATVTPGGKADAAISGTADPKDALAALGADRNMTFDENGKHTETTTGKTTDGKDVEITTVYEEIKDETGKVISYTKTVTTRELTPESTTIEETGRTDVEGAEKPTGERQPDGDATTTISAVVTPPQKPDPAAPVTDESGVTTETTVDEIREVVENSGSTEPQVVGYRVTTTRKGADGQLLSSKSDSVYGTITITKTVTQPMQQDTTDSVQTVSETVTRVYRQTVHTETATVTVTNGTLHAEMENVRKGEGHGETNMSSLQPDVQNPATDSLTEMICMAERIKSGETAPVTFLTSGRANTGWKAVTASMGVDTIPGWRISSFWKMKTETSITHTVRISRQMQSRAGNTQWKMWKTLNTTMMRRRSISARSRMRAIGARTAELEVWKI